MKKSLLVFCLILSSNSEISSQQTPRVTSFSPQGVVKQIKQIKILFSEQMIPFGDPRVKVQPFSINCPVRGDGRWIDQKIFVYEFENNLPAGIACEFSLTEDLKTLSGKKIEGQRKFSFSTGGPNLESTNPYEGSYIDEEQIFILYPDSEVKTETVISNAVFTVQGIRERVSLRIISGKEREEILKSQSIDPSSRNVLLVQATQRFPANSQVSLTWGKGIQSRSGVSLSTDQVIAFQSRVSFNANFSCERENARAGCIPITPMYLSFSAPVSWQFAKQIRLRGAGRSWEPEKSSDEEDVRFVNGVNFKGPFPENSKFQIEIPSAISDDAGRELSNKRNFPLQIKTEKFPPLAKFSGHFGIIELKADPVLPVTVRNLEKEIKARSIKLETKDGGIFDNLLGKKIKVSPENILHWLRKVSTAKREESVLKDNTSSNSFSIPKPGGADAFEVIGIPLKDAGFYVVEMESLVLGESLLGKKEPLYVSTSALVTNLSVHFKWGRESSIVWVTSLDSGLPVAGADVNIRDCKNNRVASGKSDSDGILRLGKILWTGEIPHCSYTSYDSGLLVTAEKDNDLSFVHSSWDKGIEYWRYNLPYASYRGSLLVHTVFDRPLFRAGESAHMKHFIRKADISGFSQYPETLRPTILRIQHDGSGNKYDFPVVWSNNGSAETKWQIPKEAKLGVYRVSFLKNKSEYGGWDSGEIRVEEFRVPLMKGIIQPPANPPVSPSEFSVDVFVKYLSGGGAGNLPAKLRSRVQVLSYPFFSGFEDFRFANGPAKEGRIRSSVEGTDSEESSTSSTDFSLRKEEFFLDKSGSARVKVKNLPKITMPSNVFLELEYRDPNGEMQTVATNIPVYPSKFLVGIKPDSWAVSKDALKLQAAVVDLKGKPVPGIQVSLEILEKKIYSHRKRLVGGFYAYEHFEEVIKKGKFCEGNTDKKGILSCSGKSQVGGNVILQAKISDPDGRDVFANREVWIASKDDFWFSVSDNDRMDLLSEKTNYEAGDTAKFQVRMPFKNAVSLVTVEREGVIEAYVRNLSGKQPVVEIPVLKSYTPNVFVSVLAIRGRAGNVQPTALVDLGRPTYRLGIANIKVGWKPNELKVKIATNKKIYKIREKVKLKVSVKNPDGSIPLPGTEVALAAVDEGLLELMPNNSWDILSAMMKTRGYEVRTATAQMQVVGRRHYGLKALPTGGGGGQQSSRELFDTLLFWKSKITLNSKGEADVEIPLNDSITRFRFTAIASSGSGFFGTGSTSVRTNQDLMILSGVSPIAREGDEFRSEFTVRNTTDHQMEVEIAGKIAGITKALNPQSVTLSPGEAKEISWKIIAPLEIENLTYEIEAHEKGGSSDRIKIKQKVTQAVATNVYQATIMQVDKEFRITVERPENSIHGRGGINLAFRNSLSEGLQGVRDYMQRYPYSCLEQETSRAITLRDSRRWSTLMSRLPVYLDYDGLAKYFPNSLSTGSDTLTSYILSVSEEAKWKIPDESREKMISALSRFADGSLYRNSQLQTADLTIRKISAIEALSRYNVARKETLSAITIEPNLWPTSTVIEWWNILMRMKDIPDRESRLNEAEQILRSRINLQGTVMNFTTENSDYLWWLMVSSDMNSMKLLISLVDSKKWKDDIPRIVNGILMRQKQGHWDLTTANAWGTLAMEKFSKEFESDTVSGISSAKLLSTTKQIDWKNISEERKVFFTWPEGKNELLTTHSGSGKPWMTLQSLAAIPLKKPLFNGYRIEKNIVPVDQKVPGKWSKGDILRIKLKLKADSGKTWVVLTDPVPAGSSILGTGLGRDSSLATSGESLQKGIWPAFEERSFESYRAYYEYAPEGEWTTEYTIRLNQEGVFNLPPVRIEAMYSPEMFGELPNQVFEVGR